MSPAVWTVLGVLIAAAGLVLSYVVAVRAARRERKADAAALSARETAEAEARAETNAKLDRLLSGQAEHDGRLDRIESKVSALATRVAVHDDRFEYRLRAVQSR